MKDIIIVGASKFGREVLQFVRDSFTDGTEYRVKGFLDDDPSKKLVAVGPDLDVGVIGDTHTYLVQRDDRFLVSLGDPQRRRILTERLKSRGARFLTLIHPEAYIAPTARLGIGCIVGPFAMVGSFAQLADHVLVNIYATAGHDTKIDSYCVFSPYSTVTGGSILENDVFLGTYAAITPGRRVGANTKIAAGSIVYRDVPPDSLATGNPAKVVPLGRSSVKV